MTAAQRATLEVWVRAKTSPRALPAERVKAIVEATLHTTPPACAAGAAGRPAATHCVRSMAKAQGVSKSTVQRIWDAHGLQPHRVKRSPRTKGS